MNTNTLPIPNVSHDRLVVALVICIFGGILFYNIIRLIDLFVRRKKLLRTVGIIIDGHEKLTNDKEVITVEGEVLDNDLIVKQIKKNKAKLDKYKPKDKTDSGMEVETHLEETEASVSDGVDDKKNKNLKRDKSSKKMKPSKEDKLRNKENAATEALNDIYLESDLFDSALDLYYAMKLPEISDETVRHNILTAMVDKKAEEKAAKKVEKNAAKKEKKAMKEEHVDDDVKIFD